MVKVLRECSICNQLIEGRWIDHFLKYHNPMWKPEVREKVSKALKGRVFSEETRRKLSEAKKGKTPWNKGVKGYHTSLKGRKRSEEFRKKISEATKGRIPWNKGKPRTEEEKEAISEGTRKAMANLPPEKWEEIKLKISKAEKGKHKPTNFGEKVRKGLTEHDQWIKEEMARLMEQGYKCLDIGSLDAKIPDIIAVKDGKIYAIEVERCAVDYNKWTGQTFFDDIIWVVKSKNRR